MNTTSEPLGPPRTAARRWAPLAALAALMALGACIQGPWDYYPENPPSFRGVFVSGYAVAGRPIKQMCFERMLDLGEEATEAFAFYDSAEVSVTGSFVIGSLSGQVKTLVLTPQADTPNCFIGDTAALIDRGSAYDLSARFVWDSAGHQVTSVITGTARVPAKFSIHDSAAAPSLALKGGVPADLFKLDSNLIPRVTQFVSILPQSVQDVMEHEYLDTLVKIRNDTAKLYPYIRQNGKAISDRLFELLQNAKTVYHKGDTLTYLNGIFNTLSHYYSSDRSADVKAVLITQRFDPDSGRPETRFDSPLGLKPDSSRYYFPGDHRRLLLYPDAKGRQGWNLLDSMGVVNTWFHTGLNTFYFYGTEQAYMDFNATATQVQGGGAPADGDPRIKPKYNVKGGTGFFVGAVVDSFGLNIVVDKFTKVYSLPVVHALFCDEEGWFQNADCREYYRPYCQSHAWKPADCRFDAVRACLESDFTPDTALKAACGPAADTAITSRERSDAQLEFCVETDFSQGQAVCAAATTQCAQSGANDCKRALWSFCKDNLWSAKLPQCGPALVSYCKDNNRPSEVMCSRADAYCREHSGEAACQ
jgi:hypothetical protein